MVFECLELLIVENGQTRSGRRASDVSITGLAATSNYFVVKIRE